MEEIAVSFLQYCHSSGSGLDPTDVWVWLEMRKSQWFRDIFWPPQNHQILEAQSVYSLEKNKENLNFAWFLLKFTCNHVAQDLNPERVSYTIVAHMSEVIPRKDEQYPKDGRCCIFPGVFPVEFHRSGEVDVHFWQVVQKLVNTIDPAHKNNFKESKQEKIPRWCGCVEESEHVDATIAAEREAKNQHDEWSNKNYLRFKGSQCRPLIG